MRVSAPTIVQRHLATLTIVVLIDRIEHVQQVADEGRRWPSLHEQESSLGERLHHVPVGVGCQLLLCHRLVKAQPKIESGLGPYVSAGSGTSPAFSATKKRSLSAKTDQTLGGRLVSIRVRVL